jgi:hypothetical protein
MYRTPSPAKFPFNCPLLSSFIPQYNIRPFGVINGNSSGPCADRQ